MELPITSIVIAEPPTRPKRKAATKATESFQPTQKRKRSSPSITESYEPLISTKTCPPATSSSSAPSRHKRRQLIVQNKSIVSTIQKTAARNQNVESDYTVNPCSPLQTYPNNTIFPQIMKGQKNQRELVRRKGSMKANLIKNFHKYYSIIYSNQKICY